MIIELIWIIVGFVLLIVGADILVEGSSDVAKKFHIPEIIIGLTIVSIGTSMPELFVSITSALDGFSDMAIGNVLGSNLANLLLILGLSSLIMPVNFQSQTKKYEIPMCFIFTAIFLGMCSSALDITRGEGFLLIVLFLGFIGYTIYMGLKGSSKEKEENSSIKILPSLLKIIVGIGALKIGGDFTVNHAVKIADYFHWSEKLISVTILAVGTSLPELVTSVTAAIKKKSDIAIGNIIGSNIFNLLLIIGVSSIITPITYNSSYNFESIYLLEATLLLGIFPFIPPKNKMSRMNGFIFLVLYIVYLGCLFTR